MIHHPIVGLMIGSNALVSSLPAWSILMIVCHHATATHAQCCCSVVFTTATIGSVGSDSGGLVNTPATILMLVAMLSAFAGAGKPFKSKLIFSESHKIIYFKNLLWYY
jgi:hypothetical protein